MLGAAAGSARAFNPPNQTYTTVSGPASGSVGTPIAGSQISATLSGANSPSTGEITWDVYGPESSPPSDCSSGNTIIGYMNVPGDGVYQSPTGWTPLQSGTYWWYAVYSGDGVHGNGPSNSGCGAGMSSIVVSTSPPAKTPPANTAITEAKINKKKHQATFSFKASDATSFQCALINQPMKSKKPPKPHFVTCKSPKTYKHLNTGQYTFEVRGVNAAGADPRPAIKKIRL